jgi:hypothetical protein
MLTSVLRVILRVKERCYTEQELPGTWLTLKRGAEHASLDGWLPFFCMQGLKTYNRELSVALLTNMYQDDADFTNTFRALSSIPTRCEAADSDELPSSLAQVEFTRAVDAGEATPPVTAGCSPDTVR